MSSISGPAGPAKETSAPIQPVEKKVALSVAATELKSTRIIRTAEAESKRVELSQQTFDTLANTMTFNIGVFNELPQGSQPEALKQFVEAFKAQNPKIDLKNKGQVVAQATEFLRNGGGKAILAAFKLMEWEASLLHGMSGARFIEGKAPRTGAGADKPRVYYLSKDGLTTENTKPGLAERLGNLFKGKRGSDVIGRYDMRMGNVIDTTLIRTVTTDPTSIAYLDKCGWTHGLSLGTTENSDILITRLFSIAAARTEMFLETGLKPEEVSKRLNFLDPSLNGYIGIITPHLRGETPSGYFPSRFETEMRSITADIKKDALSKSREVKNKTKEDRIKAKEGSAGAQLKAKVDELRERGKDMAPAERQAQQAVLEQEIKKLEAEAELFTRKKLLPGEKDEAQRTVVDARAALEARATAIGLNIDDILKWAGDNSEPESCLAIHAHLEDLQRQKAKIEEKIERSRKELEMHYSHQPNVNIDEVQDGKGNKRTPNQADIDRVINWNNRIQELQVRIDKQVKSYEEDKGATGKTLEQLIIETEDLYIKRKSVVEDNPETKTIIDRLKEAERTLRQKKDEETNVGVKTDALTRAGQTETAIRDTIKKKQVEKESMGGVSPDDQREIKALEAVADLYNDPSARSAMESRLADQQSGVIEDLEVSPELAGYPPVVLQAIKLMLGPEALSSVGNTEQYQRAKALLESKWYVKIMIEEIERQKSITGNDIVFPPSTATVPGYPKRAPGGKNEEITEADLKTLTIMTMTPRTLKPIATLSPNEIKQKTVRNILEAIRKSALGYS